MINKPLIGIIGLGYVGLPLFLEFSKKFEVKGFDLSKQKIDLLKKKIDYTNQYKKKDLKKISNKNIDYKSDILKDCNFFIVTVPTPITKNKLPDLSAVVSATKIICKYLKKNDYVIYESTFYPGVTEDICIKIIENETKLIGINNKNKNKNIDGFYYGYSPERINPGDLKHGIKDIVKITSGSTNASAKFIDSIYKRICLAGTHKAQSIKIAESAKVIENTQRDINIALINEFAQIFSKMNINTYDVLSAAKTKWNFLDFKPGLVGGHCIGVDPYYLAEAGKKANFNTKIILAGRNLNDSVPDYLLKNIIRKLKKDSRILLLGLSFKEDVGDIRNSKSIELVIKIKKKNFVIDCYDPRVDKAELEREYNLKMNKPKGKYDCVIVAVAHKEFIKMNEKNILRLVNDNSYIIDIKGIWNKKISSKLKNYWCL